MTITTVKQQIIAANGPLLYHGTSARRTASILEHGLDPSRTEFASTAVWLATREIADGYALERSGKHDTPAVFAVDLRGIPAEQLRADEQIAFNIYGQVAERRIRADLAAFGIDPDEMTVEEIDAEVADQAIDLTWEITDAEGFDFAGPEMVWRSFAETGNLAIHGTVPPHAVVLVSATEATAG